MADVERWPPELAQDNLVPGDWRVETVWVGREGEVSVVMFSGPFAETEARDYHTWLSDNQPKRRVAATVLRLVRPVPPSTDGES